MKNQKLPPIGERQRPARHYIDATPFRDLFMEKVQSREVGFLALETGQSQRGLWRLLHDTQWLHFDNADRLLCRLGEPMLWQEEPFRTLYYSTDLSVLDQRLTRELV